MSDRSEKMLRKIATSRLKVAKKLSRKFDVPKTIGFIRCPDVSCFTQKRPDNFVNDKRRYYRQEYLKSEHWKNLKVRKLRSTPLCEECGWHRSLDVHHLNYRNLYDVELTDLQTLCRKCHSKKHNNGGQKISRETNVENVDVLKWNKSYYEQSYYEKRCQRERDKINNKIGG